MERVNGEKSNVGQAPTVSVIVPVYKVEKYLRRCVDSILAQTYQDFEVLLVDDGSPDDCGKICDEYAERDARVRVIHQENQGLSAARNNAVPVSRGDYITFIDSDDYVTPDYIGYLISLITKYQAEISVGSHVYQYENSETREAGKETVTCFYTPEEALLRMNYGKGLGLTAWAKLYKRKLVEDNPYPVGKLYEDIATTYRIVGDSSGVAFGNQQIYYWVQRTNSIMHSQFNEKQLDGLEAARNQLAYIEKKYPAAVPAAKYRYTAKAVELAGILFTSAGDRGLFRKLKGHMNEYANEILRDPNVKKSIKIRIRAMKMGYFPARIVFAFHEKVKRAML